MFEDLRELLDWIDAYFYDAVPKPELRQRLAPLIDRADPTAGACGWCGRSE